MANRDLLLVYASLFCLCIPVRAQPSREGLDRVLSSQAPLQADLLAPLDTAKLTRGSRVLAKARLIGMTPPAICALGPSSSVRPLTSSKDQAPRRHRTLWRIRSFLTEGQCSARRRHSTGPPASCRGSASLGTGYSGSAEQSPCGTGTSSGCCPHPVSSPITPAEVDETSICTAGSMPPSTLNPHSTSSTRRIFCSPTTPTSYTSGFPSDCAPNPCVRYEQFSSVPPLSKSSGSSTGKFKGKVSTSGAPVPARILYISAPTFDSSTPTSPYCANCPSQIRWSSSRPDPRETTSPSAPSTNDTPAPCTTNLSHPSKLNRKRTSMFNS
jgi:hypothetical protein